MSIEASYFCMDKKRKIFFLLLFSGLLNIFFVVYIAWDFVRDREPIAIYSEVLSVVQDPKKSAFLHSSNAEVIEQLFLLQEPLLYRKLQDETLVEQGFRVRDLALAILVEYHDFDLSRALLGFEQPVQTRKVQWGEEKERLLTVFPGVKNQQFAAIIHFSETEKWPCTLKGLFSRLKKNSSTDPTLLNAFFLTEQFLRVEALFSRGACVLDRAEIKQLLLSGDWDTMQASCMIALSEQDLTLAKRKILQKYITKKSSIAAELIVKIEAPYIAQKYSDEDIIAILELLDPKKEQAKQFAQKILDSVRGDLVRKRAAVLLCTSVGDIVADQVDLEKMSQRFVSSSKQQPAEKQKEAFIHTVQKGDSLWKISKRYGVSIEKIKKENGLTTELLLPGKQLKI